jgi:hypothetical protein
MSYTSTTFYPTAPPGFEFHRPSGPVECRVVRADLVGIAALGARGIFHAGLLFSTPSAEWAIELTIPSFGTLVPKIVDGAVEVDNFVVLGYYPPLDAHLWRSYWTHTSKTVCTISPAQYAGLMKHVVARIGPQSPRYVLFNTMGKPNLVLDGDVEVQTDYTYTADNTCDKLPMRCFEYLRSAHGVSIGAFPITRVALQSLTPPRKVDSTDPGLLAYAREVGGFVDAFTKLASKHYLGAVELLLTLSTAHIGAFRYVLSLDFDTNEQSYYMLPLEDTSLSISDVYMDLGRHAGDHYAEATGAAFAAVDDWDGLTEQVVDQPVSRPYADFLLTDGTVNPCVGRDSATAQWR